MSDNKPKNDSNQAPLSDLNNDSDSISQKTTSNLSSHSSNSDNLTPSTPIPGTDDQGFSEISIHQSKWSAPLPHPDTLNQYGLIDQSFPERIIALTEREASHRHEVENNQMQMIHEASLSMRSERGRGQWLGFISLLILITIGSVSAFTDHEQVASVIFGTTILGVVSIFVIGRSRKTQKEDNHD